MANILTYNQVISILEDIARRHYMVNTFFLGRDWELENTNDIVYPLLQVYPESSKMPITKNGDYKTVEFELNCKVLDLVQQSETDEKDVHSDTLRIAQDIINELNQHPFYVRSNAQIVGDINFTSLEEFEDDFTAGWEFKITLKVININNFCGLPMEDITGYSASGPVYTGYSTDVQYLKCDTITACTVFQDYIQNEINTVSADTNTYTISAQLVGTTAFFDRNDQLSAYTLQLSGLTSGITATGNYLPLSGGTLTGDLIGTSITATTIAVGQSNFVNGNLSSIIGGYNNIVSGQYSVVLGGKNITATANETAYVPKLNIQILGTGTSISNLGIDINGFVVSGVSNNFSGTTNYYSRFTSGGSISNGMIWDDGISGVNFMGTDNTAIKIISPAGYYYPSLSFYNNGGNPTGLIIGYGSELYINGGLKVHPNYINLPYHTPFTLLYTDATNYVKPVTIGAGLSLSTGGTLSFTGGNIPAISATSISCISINGGNANSAQTINLTLSDQFSYILTANTTFTFSNNENGKSWIVGVTQNSTTSGLTASFTSSTATLKWAYGITPVQTSNTGKTDIYSFVQLNGIIYGDYSQSF